MSRKVFKLITGIIIVTVVALFVFVIWQVATRERIEVPATVLSHAVTTSGKYNDSRVYLTVVKRDDGVIQELTGLKYYALPEGSRIRVVDYK